MKLFQLSASKRQFSGCCLRDVVSVRVFMCMYIYLHTHLNTSIYLYLNLCINMYIYMYNTNISNMYIYTCLQISGGRTIIFATIHPNIMYMYAYIYIYKYGISKDKYIPTYSYLDLQKATIFEHGDVIIQEIIGVYTVWT